MNVVTRRSIDRAIDDHPGVAAAMPSRHWDSQTLAVQVARIKPSCQTLGPGERAVVWVQGCALRCAGCVVPESHSKQPGATMKPAELVQWILQANPTDGVSFTGGEPLLQARGLTQVVRALRLHRPEWSFMSWTGYRYEVLRTRGSDYQNALLDELDIVVDGPFIRSRARSLLWRGSENQRIVALTNRGSGLIDGREDSSVGIEVDFDSNGQFGWAGVAQDGFRDAFELEMKNKGFRVEHLPSSGPTDPIADPTNTKEFDHEW